MNDAVLIMQVLANGDRYNENGSDPNHITEEGMINADCYDPGSKLTPFDALAVQKYLLHLVQLPEYNQLTPPAK